MGLTSSRQIVLGAATLAQLHKRIGDTVDLKYVPAFPRRPIRLTIVGVATMPAIGIAEGLHTSMGIGAAVPADAGPVTETLGPQAYDSPCNGPNMVLLRVRRGSGASEGHVAAQRLSASANHILAGQSAASNCGGYVASVLGVQHPAQISNYRSIGTTPVLLAAGLAVAAVVALGLAFAASVRRCRRDLALFKVLGFVQRQLAAAVAWHASLTAIVGVAIGVPLGVVLGRWLWTLFAEEIGAVPAPRSRCGPWWPPRSAPWCWQMSPPCCPGGGRPGPRRHSRSPRSKQAARAQAIIVGLGGRPWRMSSKRVVMAPSSSGCVRM